VASGGPVESRSNSLATMGTTSTPLASYML
jgi:hypothetical protein